MRNLIGRTFGHYRITDKLGEGGMGEVYRAHDERLDRGVAIKVLHEAVAQDADRLARFEREAKAVAKLAHPNILEVWDFGREGDVTYAVTELLDGQDLRQCIPASGMPWQKVVEMGAAIADGLAAAHGKGIVHRDLKPDNVFITSDGRVKILDFGLAQVKVPVEGEAETATMTPAGTAAGTVMGTLGYMSPEQLRGEPADARSDIFALGCVLYEMLSGQTAFLRKSTAETTVAILKEEPPSLSDSGTTLPAELERTFRRCLEKSPEARFQSAQDLAFALEAVSRVSAPVRPTIPTRRRWVWAGVVVAIVAIAVIAGLWIGWPSEPPPPLRVRPITSEPGREGVPALSPDGHQVAFVKAREGRSALYVNLIDGGEPLLVAMDSFAPAWSPDGRRIAFVRHVEGEDGEVVDGVFVVPALGGAARQLATARMTLSHALSWSPDQKTLAISDTESPAEPAGIFLLSLESGERRRLTRPPAGYGGDSDPRFSPDGQTLAFVREEAAFVTDVYVVPVGGGEERRLTEGNQQTSGLDWGADGRSIVFSSWRKGGVGVYGLWKVAKSGGAPEPLEFGERGTRPTVSRRGGRLAYVQNEKSDLDIWRVGGPSAPEEEHSPTRLISSTRMDLHARYSPGGKQIAFVSQRSGAWEIWICDADGSNPRQLTFLDDPMTIFPRWSPDSRQIAFTSSKEGSRDVHVVSVSGGVPRRLTIGSSLETATSWSRDGRWVYFFSNRNGRNEVWKVSPEGGDAIQVTARGGTWATESDDGRFLYYGKAHGSGGTPGIWRIPRDGGEEVQVLDRAGAGRWTLLEQGILYVNDSSAPDALELFDLASGEVSWFAPLEVGVGGVVISVSPDGRWVLYASGEWGEADIMLVENFR